MKEKKKMLHLGKFGNLALTAGALVVPELETICHDRHNTGSVEYALLLGRQSAV
jgi:hypothetical protein